MPDASCGRPLLPQIEPGQGDGAELLEESLVACNEPRVEQADVELGIVCRELGAFAGIPDRVRDTQLGVPQRGEQCRDLLAALLGLLGLAEEQQEVDVGVREEFAPSVAANGDGGDPAAFAAELLPETAADDVVHRIGASRDGPQAVAVLEEVRAEPLHLLNVIGCET